MKAYLDLVSQIFEQGTWQENRTGVRTLSMPGAALRFDLQKGFPAVTTKKLAFKSAIGELIGFLRGSRSAANFRALGSKVWDQNANNNQAWLDNPYRLGEDDLGAIYGVQWRAWPAYKVIDTQNTAQIEDAQTKGYQILGVLDANAQGGQQVVLYKAVDQLRQCLDTLIHQPADRRIIFHGWNWAQLDEMALPPCHLLYQFLPNVAQRELSMCVYIRSNDVGLGMPFNLAESAALLHLVARLTGFTPRWLNYFVGDVHIYENHVPMLQEQVQRTPYSLPQLHIAERVPAYADTQHYAPEWLEQITPEDFVLKDYQHHPALTASMAV